MSYSQPRKLLLAFLLAILFSVGCSPQTTQSVIPQVELGVQEFGQPFFTFGAGQPWSYTHSGRRFNLNHQECTIGGLIDTNVTPHSVDLDVTCSSPVSIKILDLDLAGCTGGEINDGILVLQAGTHAVKINGTFTMWHEAE